MRKPTIVNEHNLRICKESCEYAVIHKHDEEDCEWSIECKKDVLAYVWGKDGWDGCPYKFEQEIFGNMTEEELSEYDK